MEKNFYVNFSGSLLISVPDDATIEDVKTKFFEIVDSYNHTHESQLTFCDIDSVEKAEI